MIINSDKTLIAGTAIVELAQYNAFRIHLGVRFYNLSNGVFTEVEPTAGTVALKVGKPTIRGLKDIGTLDAKDKTADLVFDGPVVQVQASSTGVTGATHFKLVIATEK